MSLFDWIYPKKCVGCKAPGRYICERCRTHIRVVGKSLRYEGVVRRLIKEIKYRGSFDMVSELVDIWMQKGGQQRPQDLSPVVITAVPMYPPKKMSRGFNQAELIARELANRWGVPYVELLVRVRATRPMYGLTREARFANVSAAFALGAQRVDPETVVVLIDDVRTSGATLGECKRVLVSSGVRSVVPIALAR